MSIGFIPNSFTLESEESQRQGKGHTKAEEARAVLQDILQAAKFSTCQSGTECTSIGEFKNQGNSAALSQTEEIFIHFFFKQRKQNIQFSDKCNGKIRRPIHNAL